MRFREAGAGIVAHVNTKARLTQPHDLLGMHFDPAPAEALPTDTFTDKRSLNMNGELVTLVHVPPAHTDTDIFIHYTKANVLHMGDVFFNGTYPFIDVSTGGNINGMIAGADRALAMTNARTKIVPGHGPLSDHAGLLTYPAGHCHDSRPRAGSQAVKKTLAQVQAARPAAVRRQVGQGMTSPTTSSPLSTTRCSSISFRAAGRRARSHRVDVEHGYVFARQACVAGAGHGGPPLIVMPLPTLTPARRATTSSRCR
jgi:hypothetical protein